jgi:hypothetical protein
MFANYAKVCLRFGGIRLFLDGVELIFNVRLDSRCIILLGVDFAFFEEPCSGCCGAFDDTLEKFVDNGITSTVCFALKGEA